MNTKNAEFFKTYAKKGIKEEKVLFAYFLALPRKLRSKEIQTQNQFADMYGVDITTLSRWKKEKTIKEMRSDFMGSFLENKTSEVLESLYNSATTLGKNGRYDIQAIKLWLELFDSGLGNKEKQNVNNINVMFPNV